MSHPESRPSPGAPTSPGRALVFGEVLFDCFPDGSQILGGAPFNVAWHLRGLGCDPLFVSAVGDDADGQEILRRMLAWEMSPAAVRKDAQFPTGRVDVLIDKGGPAYRIPPDQAWDRIRPSELDGSSPALLYHGTLALRAPESRAQCFALRDRFVDATVFVDLNLRAPWWTQDIVKRSLDGADWAKVSVDELSELTGLPTDTENQCEVAARALLDQYESGRVLVTRGDEGALLVPREREVLSVAAGTAETNSIVDTVGAGDAFSAVICCGILSGWGDRVAMERATAFALDICRIRGATSTDASLYRGHRRT